MPDISGGLVTLGGVFVLAATASVVLGLRRHVSPREHLRGLGVASLLVLALIAFGVGSVLVSLPFLGAAKVGAWLEQHAHVSPMVLILAPLFVVALFGVKERLTRLDVTTPATKDRAQPRK